MADILKAYTAISPSSSRTSVADVFNSIINAPPFTFDKTSRLELLSEIIEDLKNYGSKGKLTSKDASQALLAVKILGKDPTGSGYLASSTNLSTLLGFAASFKDDSEAASEALRCIANALLLVEKARSTFVSKEVNGGDTCVMMLEKTSSPDHIFILSRILFLSTASGSPYVETLVDSKYHNRTVVDILGSKLDLLLPAIRTGAPASKEAMTDLLKLCFNILMHYPKLSPDAELQQPEGSGDAKVIGDFWSSKLDGILPPLLRVFRDLPPTSPLVVAAPLTHVIHSLITIPISPNLRPIWFGQAVSGTSRGRNSSAITPKSKTPDGAASRNSSPSRSNSSPTSPKPSTIDRALSKIAAAGRSLSRTPSPNIVVSIDIIQRAYDLLDAAFAHYFPGNVEPDDPGIRARQKADSPLETLDDLLGPLVILISRLCIADEGCQLRVRQWVVPHDLDRTSPLEQRSDILGRCLRLLACVHHPRLKDAVGEMLYAASNSNASTLCVLVGYGNVAGFLFHKGILDAPPLPSSTSTSKAAFDADIDPITGIKRQPKSDIDMTDEEKEREMEKLFVLFDRLEKNGSITPDQNIMRQAMQKSQMG